MSPGMQKGGSPVDALDAVADALLVALDVVVDAFALLDALDALDAEMELLEAEVDTLEDEAVPSPPAPPLEAALLIAPLAALLAASLAEVACELAEAELALVPLLADELLAAPPAPPFVVSDSHAPRSPNPVKLARIPSRRFIDPTSSGAETATSW